MLAEDSSRRRQAGNQAEWFAGGRSIGRRKSGSEAIGAATARVCVCCFLSSWLLLSSRAARVYRGDLAAAPHLSKEGLVLADVRVVREDAEFIVLRFLRRG